MKLLIYSHFFAPSVGGVETLVLSLARGLAGLRTSSGQPEFEVTLATQTPADKYEDGSLPFRVVRQPNLIHVWDLIRASDVVHVAGPALAPMILGLLARRPVVVEHHGFQTICPNGQLPDRAYGDPVSGTLYGGTPWRMPALQFGAGVDCFAQALAADVRAPFSVPARFEQHHADRVAWRSGATSAIRGHFRTDWNSLLRQRRILRPLRSHLLSRFKGRLVTTKGVGVLFEAARTLLAENRAFELLVIGDGPERAILERVSQDAPLAGHVRFAGRLLGAELDAALAHATVVVVPSLGGEVFRSSGRRENMPRSAGDYALTSAHSSRCLVRVDLRFAPAMQRRLRKNSAEFWMILLSRPGSRENGAATRA